MRYNVRLTLFFAFLIGFMAETTHVSYAQITGTTGLTPAQLEAMQAGAGMNYSTIPITPGPANTTIGRDTSYRRELILEEYDLLNPSKLEKIISDRIDQDGVLRDVRTGNLNQYINLNDIPTEDNLPIDYEIVIKDGQFIRRALPVVFGREIFSSRNLTFAPSYNIPTPVNYIVGADDELIVEVWGASEFYTKQKISPEGTISIQGVGPVNVGGLTIEQAERRVQNRVSEFMGGAHVSVTLGQIRSIKVNIAGEVNVPGTYTLPSLATVFNAIYSAGGVNNIGSLRGIKVYRDSKEIATLDVYEYLINGKYNTNIRLQDNDMIIVPPYDSYVSISGKIKRERVYEMKRGETLSTLIDYAGGFTGDAYNENINVKRKTGRQFSIQTVNKDDFSDFALFDGDSIIVERIIDDYANRVVIEGAVWRPGEYELSEKTSTLAQLIEMAEGLRGDEFATRGQIVRRKSDFTHEMIPFNVRDAATGLINIPLQKEDSVFIPNILELREEYNIVVKGEVNNPDTLNFREGMTIEDAILRSGGLRESASYANLEIARRVKDPNSLVYTNKIANVYTFRIEGDLSINPVTSRFELQPFDEVFIRRSPGYSEQQSVIVSGEVLFGGEYVLTTAGERISDIILKAGGLTPEAYVRGASVKRRMTDDERAKVETMIKILTSNTGPDTLNREQLDLDLNASYPIGIDVEYALNNPGSNDDIILRDGDEVFIPKHNSTVKISGSVMYPNSVSFNKKQTKYYISQAGGYSDNARKRPFVVYMNGKVASTRGRIFWKSYPTVEPGAEIVVPTKLPKTGQALTATTGVLSSTASLAAMIATIANLAR